MIKSLVASAKRNLLNIPGLRTDRQIVVIESDDWGAVRLSSKKARTALINKGYPLDECGYNTYDGLETEDDLHALYDALRTVIDQRGAPAKITANFVVANPAFETIRSSNYEQYTFEKFTDTYLKNRRESVFSTLLQGVENNFLQPQLHGREHLQYSRWILALQQGNKALLDALAWDMYSLHAPFSPNYRFEYMDALAYENTAELENTITALREGIQIFQEIWGFHSISFIAPCYVWGEGHEQILADHRIAILQGINNQFKPILRKLHECEAVRHFMGGQNAREQFYLIRNVFFEPALVPKFDWVSDAMNRITMAFRWKKPAIIGSHRLNYMGSIFEQNRSENLSQLVRLLKLIKKRWPAIEFMTTDQLGREVLGIQD